MKPKKKQLQEIDESTLFKSLALEWLDSRKAVIKEPTYLRDLSVFEKDLFPYIGDLPIDQIKGKDVLECAKRIEDRGAQEMAKAFYSFGWSCISDTQSEKA